MLRRGFVKLAPWGGFRAALQIIDLQVAAVAARDDVLAAFGEKVRVQGHEVAVGHGRQIIHHNLILLMLF